MANKDNKADKSSNGACTVTTGLPLHQKVQNLVSGIFVDSGIQERLREALNQLVREEVQVAVDHIQATVAHALGLQSPTRSKPPRELGERSPSREARRKVGRPATTGKSVGRNRGYYSENSAPGKIEKLLKSSDGPLTAVEIGKQIWPDVEPREARRRASIAVAAVVGIKRSGPPKERLYTV